MSDCHLSSCRYNRNGKCTNEFERKVCVDVSKLVLCLEESNDGKGNQTENNRKCW